MRPSRIHRRSGFTILELLVVMVILVIISAVAYPTIQAWFGDTKIKADADEIRGSCANARAHAIDEGVQYRFAVMPDSGRYKFAPDTDEHWSNVDDSTDTEDSDGGTGPFVIRRTLSEGILFTPPRNADGLDLMADDSGWVTIATFLPDGTCREDSIIELAGNEFPPIIIRIRGLTGTVTVAKGKKEGQ